jgi:SgrR family transcriptional regulator
MNPDTPLLRQQSGRQQIAAILQPESLFPEISPARKPAYGLLPEWQHRPPLPPPQRVAAGTRLRLISGQTKEMRQLAEQIKALLEQAGFSVEWKTITLKEQIARDWLQQCDLYLGREMLHDDKDFGCFEWFGNDSHFRHWLPDSMNQWLDKQLCDIQSMPAASVLVSEPMPASDANWYKATDLPVSHEPFVRSPRISRESA